MLMSTEGRAGGWRQRQREASLLRAWPEGPGQGEHRSPQHSFISSFAFFLFCIHSLTHSLVRS